ncbi:ABC transporter substrate-binding protein [Mycobacterium sp. 852002-10029_SCH5224772]|uniref:ABC transporter substrate-binding protein n=1 Tax=Mycobacterium sp. 852002-10029_SCH5224772 TaxID=1834083 RepID=UPI0018D34A67|nr:ABC transporter substrate-binding protein [Mycobacterium sp. 852002-10029_SCH5224772]
MAARAVLVTPLSGPLARFGIAGASAVALWADSSGVSLEVIDAYPSAASAMRAAEASRPNVVFGPYGSGPALAAAAASTGVVWNHGGATARLARPAYPRVVNVESPAYRYLAAVLETLVADGVGEGSEVVIVHVDTGFGREVAEGAATVARRLGLLWRSVTFRPGRARDMLAQVPAGDVLLSAGSFDDDVAIAQWASERRWRAVGLVAAGVDELRHAIGDRVEGLYGPCQWFDDGTDDPADGPDSEWFSHCYRSANGTEPPYPAAAAFAAGVVWQRCAMEADTIESLPVMAASQRLDTTTLFGRFRVDPVTGVQTGHQIRVVQWRDGQRLLVDRPPRRT